MGYTVDRTHDEDGVPRFFVADTEAHWTEGPFDSEEEAQDAIDLKEREDG